MSLKGQCHSLMCFWKMSDAIVDLLVSENNLHLFCIHDFYVNEVAQNFLFAR